MSLFWPMFLRKGIIDSIEKVFLETYLALSWTSGFELFFIYLRAVICHCQ